MDRSPPEDDEAAEDRDRDRREDRRRRTRVEAARRDAEDRREPGDEGETHGAVEQHRGHDDRRRSARRPRPRRPREDGRDPQGVAANPPGQQDAPGLGLDRDPPDLRQRQVDPREGHERAPAPCPGQRREHIQTEEACHQPAAGARERRQQPRLALQAGALARVNRHVPRPNVEDTTRGDAGHGDTRRARRARVPASVAHGGHPHDERDGDRRQRPREDACPARRACRRSAVGHREPYTSDDARWRTW